MKVFHITSWYPSKEEPNNALWIKRHIEALNKYTDNIVAHVEIKYKKGIAFRQNKLSDNEFEFILYIPFAKFFFIELYYFFLLLFVIGWKFRKLEFDCYNFHISYPQLTYFHWLKHFIKERKIFVTEHWSAYHYSFKITDPTKLVRIKRIFRNNFHWITVSRSLRNDLIDFSEKHNLQVSIVPNVVDETKFNYVIENDQDSSDVFFMVANWQWPKQPLLILSAYKEAKERGLSTVFRIGGYGKDWGLIENFVVSNNLSNSIILLGPLTSEEIASEMHSSIAYLHCSEYETFSVVCAESLCCGTPVISSKVGGIIEFVDEASGMLIENSLENWIDALLHFSSEYYSSEYISKRARTMFSSEAVGKQYFDVLNEV